MIKKISSICCLTFLIVSKIFGCDGIFEETHNPYTLVKQIRDYCVERQDYHLDMVETISGLQLMQNYKEKAKTFECMYGLPNCPDSMIMETLSMAYKDHRDWANQFKELKDNLDKGFDLDQTAEFYKLNLLMEIQKTLESGIEFYLGEKQKTLKMNFQDAIIGSQIKVKFQPKVKLKTCKSIFLKNHYLRVFEDISTDFKRLGTSLDLILGYMNLTTKIDPLSFVTLVSPETHQSHIVVGLINDDYVDPLKRKDSLVYQAIGDNKPYLNLPDFVSITSLYNPKAYEMYASMLASYGKTDMIFSEEVEAKTSIVGTNEVTAKKRKKKKKSLQEIIPPMNIPEEVKVTTPELIQEAPKEEAIDLKISVVEPQIKQIEEKDIEKNEVTVESKSKENSQPQNTAQLIKKKKKKNQKQTAQKVKPAVEEFVSYNLALLPIGKLLGKDEFNTFDSILKYDRNTKWDEFNKLITSKKGFNGVVLKNSGGSLRRICFLNPLTQTKVSFMVHKTHKPGKGESGILYTALIKRIIRNFEKFHLLNKR